MAGKIKVEPEHTAVRVALWRALHVHLDAKPHILVDDIGEKIVGDPNWRSRPDMDPQNSRRVRASIVSRARYIEDLVEESVGKGVTQYVILGAGLDSFAQRRLDLAPRMQIFEIDQPGPQEWKKQRLVAAGFSIPEFLKFVPVDFEAGQNWWERLVAAGFDPRKPAVVVSTGVSMYLSEDANRETLRAMSKLAPGSVFAMTVMLPMEMLDSQDQAILQFTMKKAAEAGTPFLSFFGPQSILALAKEAGIPHAEYFSPEDMRKKYFDVREDGLEPPSAEAFLIAKI